MNRKLLFRSLKSKIMRIIILEALIDAFVFFLVVTGILVMIDKSMLYSAIFSLACFVISFMVRVRRLSLYLVEHKYPHLKEILRTCADNIDKNNIVVNQLYAELENKLSYVSNYNFLNRKRFILKIILLCFVSFMLVFASSYKASVMTFGATSGLKHVFTEFEGFFEDAVNNPKALASNLSMKFDNSDTKLELISSGKTMTFEEVQDAKDLNFKSSGSTTGEVLIDNELYDEVSYEKEDEETIKNYFNNLNQD